MVNIEPKIEIATGLVPPICWFVPKNLVFSTQKYQVGTLAYVFSSLHGTTVQVKVGKLSNLSEKLADERLNQSSMM